MKILFENCGLTMLELLLVLTVMLIISNMAAVSFASVDKRQLNQACIQLQGDLRYAQRMAVLEGRKYQVIFLKYENKYQIYKFIPNNWGVFKSVLIKEIAFENGITLKSINATASTVTYTQTGTTSTPCTIELTNAKFKCTLTVNLGSGRIVIKDMITIY